MENEVLKAIKERRSIRRFKADQITDEELKTVLEAGTWAATGHGTQEPFIIAVQNPEICAQLRKMNAEIMGVESDPYYGAPRPERHRFPYYRSLRQDLSYQEVLADG